MTTALDLRPKALATPGNCKAMLPTIASDRCFATVAVTSWPCTTFNFFTARADSINCQLRRSCTRVA